MLGLDLQCDARDPNVRTNKGLRAIGPLLKHLGADVVAVYQDTTDIHLRSKGQSLCIDPCGQRDYSEAFVAGLFEAPICSRTATAGSP